ncbi:DUF6056 family protein [Dokdonella soli]|uniref:Tetratricopeptide repeat protein n=1 Tax=Dokdonella soli TaxID=529810 RepID=A0ABN1IHV9_9GAMM
MSTLSSHPIDSRWWLLVIGVVCVLIYLPGLDGNFLFDDFPNIVWNPAIQAIQKGTPDWLAVAFLTGEGLMRRPISMLSFGLNVREFGMNPFAFKLVNLIIHLMNGTLLYALSRRIADRLAAPQCSGPSNARALALIVTGLWLLHPLLVSSVLYIVQRMNLLATLFILMGLLCYADGRLRMLRGERSLPMAIAGIFVFGLLATLCKENGALIVAYALVIEFLCFRFEAPPHARRVICGFFWLSVAMPLALFAAYLALHPESLIYMRNGFTLYTRLLSEARVVCDYLIWIFVPLPSFMGMYHDDILVSSGLFAPITTAISIAFLLGLAAIAWRLRMHVPALAFGVAWFLIGHSMESTIFPLELVFEHRNYLPMAGLLLGTVCALASASASRWPSPRVFAAVSSAAVVVLAGITATRADSWRSALSLAMSDAVHHPMSSRSQYEAGRAIALEGANNGNLETVAPHAASYLKRAAELDRNQVFPAVSLILLRGTSSPAPLVEITDLADRLKNAASNEQANPFLDMLVTASEGKLSLTASDMSTLIEAALANPRWRPQVRAMMFNDYGAYMFNIAHNQQAAISLTNAAAAADPRNPYFELNLAKIALAVGRKDMAVEHLESARRLNNAALYDRDIDVLQQQIDR